MSGFFERLRAQRPKTSAQPGDAPPRDIPDNLWVKCSRCGTAVFRKVFEEQLRVCDKCGHHHKLGARERVAMLADADSFVEWNQGVRSADPLQFGPDYMKKLAGDREKTGLDDAALTGRASVAGQPIALGVMDFGFRGGSMGSVVGEKITALMEQGVEERLPVVVVTSSGGARMQEGIYSLMQMAKTSAARVRLQTARLPYLVVLTDPTTAGVAASFAALGDVILAEPNAIIGFSGARVIEQTIRQKLPEGFQTSEFYLKHGFIDRVVPRKEMKSSIARLLGFLTRSGAVASVTP
jgi:acetyl-CoA carboxylase carboxyl transferase subunit beta